MFQVDEEAVPLKNAQTSNNLSIEWYVAGM